jgi:hypothetical protein
MLETLLMTLHSRVSAECRGSLKDPSDDLPGHLHGFPKILVATAPNDPSIVYAYDPAAQKWISVSSEKKPHARNQPVFERKRDKEYGKIHIVEAASKCPLVRKMVSRHGFAGVEDTPICLLAKWLGSKGTRMSVHKAILRSKLIFRVDDANLFLDSNLKRIVAADPSLYKGFVREAVDADDLLFNGQDPFKVLSYLITINQMKGGGIAIEHEALLVDRPVKRSCKKLQQQISMLVGARRGNRAIDVKHEIASTFGPQGRTPTQTTLSEPEIVTPTPLSLVIPEAPKTRVVVPSETKTKGDRPPRVQRPLSVSPPPSAEPKAPDVPSSTKPVPVKRVIVPSEPTTSPARVKQTPSPSSPEAGTKAQKKANRSVVDTSAYFYQALDSMAAVFTLYNDPSVNAAARAAFDNMREKMFLVDEFVLSTRVDYSPAQLRNLGVFGYEPLDTFLERSNTFHNRVGIRLLMCASEDDLAVVNMMVDAMRVDALSAFGSVEGISPSAIQRFEAYQSKWKKGMVRDLVDFNSEIIALRFEQLREAANNYFDLDSILGIAESLTSDREQLDEIAEIRAALKGPRRGYAKAYHRTVDPFKNGLVGSYGSFADLARNIRIDDSIPKGPSSPASSSS